MTITAEQIKEIIQNNKNSLDTLKSICKEKREDLDAALAMKGAYTLMVAAGHGAIHMRSSTDKREHAQDIVNFINNCSAHYVAELKTTYNEYHDSYHDVIVVCLKSKHYKEA
jgi:hypothetical protein